MGFIQGNREQIGMLGYSLDDFVEKDSKARFIVKIIEELNTQELYSRYSSQGGAAIDPKIQLATWFMGYCEGVTSSRRLEYSCKKNLDFIYISSNLQPDHSSLSRFRKRHLNLLGQYFEEIIYKAYELGVSDFKEIAIDGTKLASVSSKKKSMASGLLESRLKKVKEDIAEYLEATEEAEFPEDLEKEQEKLEKANSVLAIRKGEIKKENQQSHQVNIEEPDAVMLTSGRGRGSFPGYNAQVSTDTKTQLITSCEIVQDRNDEKQFIRQWSKIEKNLGGDRQRKYVADGGYNSHGIISVASSKNIDAYIGNRRKESSTKEKIIKGKKFTKEDYHYDQANDQYICPAGKKLSFIRKETNKAFKGKKYRSENCNDCQLKRYCFSKRNISGLRELGRDDRENLVEAMREKIGSPAGQAIMFRRQTTVEAVIGNIKSNMGYSRFRLKGLKAVNSEFTLMCIGHNLNKLYKLFRGFILNKFYGIIDEITQAEYLFSFTKNFNLRFTYY